jgi:hypothetical protein
MFIACVVSALISTEDFVRIKMFSISICVFAIPFAENSVVGVATYRGLDDLRIESQWGAGVHKRFQVIR